MDWTDNKQIAIPASHKEEANAVAEVIDPDIGGAQTFRGEATHSPDGTAPPTHIVAHTQLKTDTYGLLAEGTPEQIADEVQAEGDTGLDRSTLETVAQAMEIEAGYEEVLQVGTPLNGTGN
jgi:alkanesulfonate monooxygenase SsuD/methylene tetrahydromethanopterin reductase-like flavin-dependent oxidoreductase (luciferase family)